MSVALHGGGGNKGLIDSNAKQKHVIIISDGDPAAPNANLVAEYKAAKVSVSTVTRLSARHQRIDSEEHRRGTEREILRPDQRQLHAAPADFREGSDCHSPHADQ